jgi:hypothetical protein
LIENFKKLGYFNDADKAYYSFRNGNREYLSIPYKQLDWTLMALYGYGTRPERPIYWIIVVISICGFVFYLTNGTQKSNGQKISIQEALLFSTTALISGARAIGVFVSDPSDLKIVGNSRYLVTIERFLGLILFAHFLTALARTVIR